MLAVVSKERIQQLDNREKSKRMKKFMKFCAVAAVSMIIIGFLLAAVVSVTKGTEYLNDFLRNVTDGKIVTFITWMENAEEWQDGGKELLEGVGEGAGNLVESVITGYENFEGYDIEDSTMFDNVHAIESGSLEREFKDLRATKLNIELGGCELDIQPSDDQNIRIITENIGKFQAYQRDDELNIKATRNAKEDSQNCKIMLYLPEGYAWEKIDAEVGAGVIRIQNLAATEIDLEVGAGQILAEYMEAGDLDISVGAGEARLDNMKIRDLDVSVGMGNFAAAGIVEGKVDAECSMGNLTLQLAAAQTDYDYEIECVMGNINLGDEKYSKTSGEKIIDNGAGRKISLECSMGNIEVIFGK